MSPSREFRTSRRNSSSRDNAHLRTGVVQGPFAHRKSVHHLRRCVIDDHDRFEADLYATLSVTVDEFAKLITDSKHYRDKFVAHLNEEQIMRPPRLDLPKKSVVFLLWASRSRRGRAVGSRLCTGHWEGSDHLR